MGLNDNIKRININKYNDTHIIITCYEKMIILKQLQVAMYDVFAIVHSM